MTRKVTQRLNGFDLSIKNERRPEPFRFNWKAVNF